MIMKLATRREMIKKLSIGVGSIMLNPGDILSNSFSQQRKLGVALVGLGNYSNLQLGPALLFTKHCYLAGLVTGTPEKAKAWAEKYNVPSKNIYNYQNFDTIKDNPDIDIVYIVLPNFLHAEYTIRAAKAGKHVICEKPLAMNVKECKQMIEACNKANVKFGVGYRLFYEPHHQEARRLGMSNEFGKIKLIESSLGFTRPAPTTWRLNKAIGGGGAIMDLGVYAIQGARRIVGTDPVSVTAQAFNFDKEHFKGIWETVLWQFQFAGGEVAHCSTTYSAYVDRLYTTCERGWFEISPAYNAAGIKGRTIKGAMNIESPKYQQVAQMDDFAISVMQKKQPEATALEGMKDIMIIEAILKAADTGRRIKIDYK